LLHTRKKNKLWHGMVQVIYFYIKGERNLG